MTAETVSELSKFETMIHYFISKGQHIPAFGRTVLYKTCYFTDMDFYELHERSVSGEKYRRLPKGPAPFFFDKAMEKLERLGIASEERTDSGGYTQYRYKTDTEPDLGGFTEEEREMLDWEFKRLGSKTATELSALSHLDVPWIIADDRGEISYEAVFYRNPETSVLGDEECGE